MINRISIFFSLLLLLSCSEENTSFNYPRTFIYQSTVLKSSEGIAIKNLNEIDVIGSSSGGLKYCKDTLSKDYKDFALAIGSYIIQSFKLLNEDSIEVSIVSSNDLQSIIFPSTEGSSSGLLIDTSIIKTLIHYDSLQEEIRVCMKVFASLPNTQSSHQHPLLFELVENCDNSDNPFLALNNYVVSNSFYNGDTVAVYFLDLIYK